MKPVALFRLSSLPYPARSLFGQQSGFQSIRLVASRSYSSKTSATRTQDSNESPPSPEHESTPASAFRIMSSQEFHRRLTRLSVGGFDPAAEPFASMPDVAVPPPSWQPQPGQVFRGGQVPANTLGANGYTARGKNGEYPVFYYDTHARPSSNAGTAAPGPSQANGTVQIPGLGQPIAPKSQAEPIVGGGKGLKKKKNKQQDVPPPASSGPPNAAKGKKRKYEVPSLASGGVPNPTMQYITQSALAPTQLPYPRRILVVIDLNGTLLHRPNHRNSAQFVERPFARTFLDYCLKTFVVAIWSSAKPENVRRMVPQLLGPEDEQRLVAVWGRDTLGLSPADYNQRVQVYKRLDTVWRDPHVAASHPEAHLGAIWDQTNTVLIDDSREKGRSEPFNLIQLPEFTGDAQEPGFVLPQVHDYLNECSRQNDVSSYIKGNPFIFNDKFQLET
jgi:hypothetical protein